MAALLAENPFPRRDFVDGPTMLDDSVSEKYKIREKYNKGRERP
jgi:hypothetical protein